MDGNCDRTWGDLKALCVSAARPVARCCAMVFDFLFDLLYFEIVGVPCVAPSAGIYKGLLGLKNDAVRSGHPAIRTQRPLMPGIIGPSLSSDIPDRNARQHER